MKARYFVYAQTFMLQKSFTDNQRNDLMELAAKVAEKEQELINIKFKEIVNE